MNRMRFASWVAAGAILVGTGVGFAAEGEKKAPAEPEAAFKKMDKDSDGKLTLAEFLGKASEDAEKAKKGEARFKKLDKDSDGSLSLDEFKAGAKKAK